MNVLYVVCLKMQICPDAYVLFFCQLSELDLTCTFDPADIASSLMQDSALVFWNFFFFSLTY